MPDDSTEGGELRRNAISGKLTIVAPDRAARPHDNRAAKPDDRTPSAAPPTKSASAPASAFRARPGCPFCPGHEAMTPPEVEAVRPDGSAPDTEGWSVRAVPNKYPALARWHEVIVHSPDHSAELEDLSIEQLAVVAGMYQRRIAAQLEASAAAATLIVNRGAIAGASLEHPHAQLFATPVVPPALHDELMEFERHRNRYGTCVLCDAVESAGERLVLEGGYVAWTPDAPRFAYEVWLAPAEHVADVRDADPAALAGALKNVLTAVVDVTADGPLNLWIHTAPADLRGPYHWHVEIAPRRSGLAGFELGTDIGLVSIDPVAAAAELRAALPDALR